MAAVWLTPAPAHANEFLCEPAFQDCRAPLLTLINNETVEIDVAFWFMQDTRYEVAILNRWKAGVPVRVLVDPKANPIYTGNAQVLADLAAAGIPMRYRLPTAPGILHWKMMLFAGQNTVQFSGANYSPTAFVFQSPYSDYEDETPYFTDDPAIVNTFKTKYDDLWLDTTYYGNYANVPTPLARTYPIFTKDPSMNFPQQEDYALRILKRYAAEKQKIDVIMYRVTDERHTNAMIAAMQRGVPVRIISDTFEYRNPAKIWVAFNLDRLFIAGVPLKVRAHLGLNHQKLVIMYSQALAVFGSSNWTSPSANQQQEHNYFTTKPWMFQWFVDEFERKWNNLAPNGAMETDWFQPLPPDKPVYLSPAASAVGVDRSLQLKWDGGPWGQVYDIYFGTDPNPPLLAGNQQLGPTDPSNGITQRWTLPLLQPGTTYYWKIVTKTMAGLSRSGPVATFTTAGTTPPPPPPATNATTTVIWTATDVSPTNVVGNWQWAPDSTAAGGQALWNPDKGQAKISPPLATPANYFETTFNAVAGVPYHLWLRLKAQFNSTTNNSVSVQFDSSFDQFGTPLYQIGSAQGAEVILQGASGTPSGWGWADNGFNNEATLIYFATSGPKRIRVQQRYDGAFVDQIVMSPDAFLSADPGSPQDDATIYGSTIDGAPPPPSPPAPPPPAPPIPAPWQQQDIGAVGMPGYANFDDATSSFTSEGGGADIFGTADAFHYVYQPLSGDGSIVARVASVQNTNAWTKAGVMIRESLLPGSTNALMLVAASKGLNFQARTTTSGTSTSIAGPLKPAPYWVRIDRAGNTFTGYRSIDGVTWTAVGTYTIAMAPNALVGLAVSSHDVNNPAVAVFDQVTINGSASCGYVVTPATQSIGPDGGVATVSIATGAACSWTAESSDPTWLTVTSGASGKGNGTVTLSVAANTAGSRTATITAAGRAATVSQAPAPCTLAISPASASFAVGGGTATFGVTAGSWCTWNATSSDTSWLTVTSGSPGTGDGTVTLSAAANSGPARSATVTIGNQTFTASQTAADCTYTVSPLSKSFAAGGETTTVSVTTASFCTWTAVSNDTSWLTVTGGASGTGNGVVTLAAAANGGAARATTATIAGQVYTASQAAAPCGFAISPTSQTFGPDGGTAVVNVSGGAWCSWTAQSNATFLTVTSGASGAGAGQVSIGVAATAGPSRSGTVTIAGLAFSITQNGPGLPAGWTDQDIGAVGVAGSAAFDGTTFSVAGAGADVWGTADAFHFAYQSMTGDGRIIARVASLQNTNVWAKAGVMIRETLDPGSAHAFMIESFSKGLAFQRRTATGGISTATSGALAAAPYWVRLDRVGNTFTGYQSTDGVMWTVVGSDTIPMAATVLVGLGATSHNIASAQTATFDNVSVASGAPPAWAHKDIGAVAIAGNATFTPAPDTFSVKGAGADIWGAADAFHFAYRTMTGDGVVIARVATNQNTNLWMKAGVMIRETLDPGSANALMLVSFGKGLQFQRRLAAGGVSVGTAGALAGAPYFVKLERLGNTFNAYSSPDGTSWTLVGSDTIPMAANVYVGLAVTSHNTAAAATATFDGVSIP